MTILTQRGSGTPATSRISWQACCVAAVVMVLVAAAAFAAGRRSAPRTEVLRGTGYVGDHETSVRVHEMWAGVSGSVEWFDTDGAEHESGWPACLNHVGEHMSFRFGVTPVTGPGEVHWWQISWVDCRGAHAVR